MHLTLLAPSTIIFFYLFGDKNLCPNTILPTKINCVVKLHCINLLEYTTVTAHLKCSLSQESDGSFLGMLFFPPSTSERGSAVCRGSESTSMYIKSEKISHQQSFMGLSLVQCDFLFFLHDRMDMWPLLGGLRLQLKICSVISFCQTSWNSGVYKCTIINVWGCTYSSHSIFSVLMKHCSFLCQKISEEDQLI